MSWSQSGNNLTTTDNVGIGTTNPDGNGLTVSSGSSAPSTIFLGQGTDGTSTIVSSVVPAYPGPGPHPNFLTNGSRLVFSTFPIATKLVAAGSPPPAPIARLSIDEAGNVGISGAVRINQTAQASDTNEIYFADNGQIRSLDNNHRIIFNRAQNDLEIREYGSITLSPGATGGQRTGVVRISPTNVDIGIGAGGVFMNTLVQVGGSVWVFGDGRFSGDVILTGADCAEDFDIAGAHTPEPGTVLVIDEGGALRESRQAYDKKVAGVVSGAGEYRHGLVLDKRSSQEGRIPVALVGKVYCKVDAHYSPIEVGDLLTTSQTPGHAMKAGEPARAFGAVIGKALAGLEAGQGLIPILIALQ